MPIYRAPVKDKTKAKENYVVGIDERDALWGERLLQVFSDESKFKEILAYANLRYQEAGAPAEWAAAHKIGVKIADYNVFVNNVNTAKENKVWSTQAKQKGASKYEVKYDIFHEEVLEDARATAFEYAGMSTLATAAPQLTPMIRSALVQLIAEYTKKIASKMFLGQDYSTDLNELDTALQQLGYTDTVTLPNGQLVRDAIKNKVVELATRVKSEMDRYAGT